MSRLPRSRIRRLTLVVALGMSLALGVSSSALGGLVPGGTLPTAGFTYTSDGINDVNMAGNGIQLKTKGAIDAKTTYSRVDPSASLLGPWHYHNGPVIVTVTNGTLTFYGGSCETWDVREGETYIETTGQVLNAKALPDKNDAGEKVEWFTTRLYPDGAADPVGVAAPCTP